MYTLIGWGRCSCAGAIISSNEVPTDERFCWLKITPKPRIAPKKAVNVWQLFDTFLHLWSLLYHIDLPSWELHDMRTQQRHPGLGGLAACAVRGALGGRYDVSPSLAVPAQTA